MNLFRLVTFSFFLITSLIANAESIVETSSGIVDGYKKGRVLYWDDIPYAKKIPTKAVTRSWQVKEESNDIMVMLQKA